MELRLLGEMEARVGDDVVDLGPRQQRLVLAALALEANRLVPLEKLIDLLWPVSPTRTAAHAVQVCVSRLRSLLTGSGVELVTRGSAYFLSIEPSHVDAHLFQALVKQARAATDDNQVATLLDQALALWRGPALADVADADSRDRLCGGLAEMRLVAVEDRLDALLRLGRHQDVVGELTEWVAAHPARERFVGQLMLALYRGRQASKALEVGRRHREYLAGDLGLDPGDDLRQLELAILRNDPALKAPTARTPPVVNAAMPARLPLDVVGFTGRAATLGQLDAAEQAHDAEDDRRAADHHPHTADTGPASTLPADTGAFTGRAREIQQITAATSGGQVLVIHAIAGMPGIGKTALAVHVAHQLGERFPDGRIFVDLHGHTAGRSPAEPGDVLARLLAADGVDPRQLPAGTEARSALWRARLTSRRALIVLDNAVDSAQVSPLLPASTGCLVLVTSRRFLGDLPTDAVPVSLDVLTAAEAEQMFLRLAPHAGTYREQVADLMAACGFLPLAITLLARVLNRHRGWTVADLLTETRTRLLDIAAEHASIRAAFELSYQHLPAARQHFFRQLPLHPGTEIEPHAAAALAGVRLSEATSQLDALHADSLLTEVGYHRYTMHDLIRAYASTLVAHDTAEDRRTATDRLLDFYQRAAAAANARLSRLTRPTASSRPLAGESDLPCPAGPDQALAWLRIERANLLACLASTDDPHRIVALTAGLTELLRRDGPWTDALILHTHAVKTAADLGDKLEHANALGDLATVRRLSGDYPGAAKDMRLALEIHQALGNRLGEANARTGLGKALSRIADYPAAAAVVQPALDLYRDLDDLPGTAGALVELAIARAMTSNFHGAQEVLRQALALYRQLDDRPGQAYALRILGIAHGRAGDFTHARELLQQTLELYRELGARLGQALTLTDLGWATTGAGDYPEATRILRTALHLNREINHRIGQSSALKHLGGALRRAGDLTAATATLHEALMLYQDIGNRSGEAMVLNELGVVHRLTGHVDRAVTAHQDALDLATQIPSPWDQAQSLAGFGRCALARDQRHEGTAQLRQALDILQRIRAGEAVEIAAELAALT